MELSKLPLPEFTDALAGKTPVPGGGGASALCASLGAALCSMVANYTVGKEKYAAVEADVSRVLGEAEELRAQLLALIDADAAAFEPLSRAYGIPKDDPNRAETLEKCLHDAAAVPMEIARLSCRAIDLHAELLDKGSVMMRSDVGTGVIMCWGALYGAALNVKVNTKLMRDRACADALSGELDALIDAYWKRAEAVYEAVLKCYE